MQTRALSPSRMGWGEGIHQPQFAFERRRRAKPSTPIAPVSAASADGSGTASWLPSVVSENPLDAQAAPVQAAPFMLSNVASSVK